MSQLILFEDYKFANFLPLVYWRAVVNLRCGRRTLLDSTAMALGQPVEGIWVRDWIAAVAAMRNQTAVNRPVGEGTVLLNGRWLVRDKMEFHAPPYVAYCGDSIAYIACDRALAERVSAEMLLDESACRRLIADLPSGEIDADLVAYPWDLVARNGDMLRQHWAFDDRAANGKVSSSAYLLNSDRIHMGERSDIKPTAVIDAENGPVYISNDTVVDVHTYIEGPAYIGPGSVVKPHSSIRGGTTVGALCKVAGEISNCIITGHTNKQHDGFLGQAYVGSWVNFGAGTTNSNLKNTYGAITVQLGAQAVPTGERFLGGVIGDFVRLGIGQLLPTGAVVGFGAMVANGGFAPKHTRSLAWLTADGETATDVERLLQTARAMAERRKVHMEAEEETLFHRIPELVERYGV